MQLQGFPIDSHTFARVRRIIKYVISTSCNVVVLRRIILYCNIGWHVKDGVVHRSRQQWLVAKWLGLGLGPGNGVISFLLRVKMTKTFVLLSWHVTVQRSRHKNNSM